MACGLLYLRLQGNALLVRSFGGRWEDLPLGAIEGACCIFLDAQPFVQEELAKAVADGVLVELRNYNVRVPTWLADAAQHNYHDGAALAQVALAFNVETEEEDDEEDSDGENKDESVVNNQAIVTKISASELLKKEETSNAFVTKSSSCLQCRGLPSSLCDDCEGAFFCTPPRPCRTVG
jgi:hypothetical protein